jgi:NADH-quinone oxidoreductase subunit F
MDRPLIGNLRPDGSPLDLKAYEQGGGYQGLKKALGMAPKDVQKAVTDANLRGRGGAGFPTGPKWSFVPMDDGAPHPKYLIANADEMEPGTFKDRVILEQNPHELIEGTVISAFAIQADIAYIFLRDEYKLAAQRLQQAIREAYDAHFAGEKIGGTEYKLELYLHISAGRYMCGEETGLLNALEGKRANPRSKPPFPQTSGLFGKPTIVNNVETLANVPHIISHGVDWYKGLSRSADGGTKLYGASGHVKKPGLWELPMGTTIREILDQAGGMQDGYSLRALLPGGASTDFLTPEHFDVKMDFDSVMKVGSRLGTGTMIILDDKTCPVGFVLNLEQFFAQESCGWCTPCWGGLQFVVRTLQALEDGNGRLEDLDLLAMHCKLLGPGNTYCALAPGAAEPLQSALKYFGEDFERHIRERRCPWK